MTELYDLTAAELHDGYRDGTVSPVEVTKAVLARIEAWEPKINAMYLIHRETALQAAKESEARWRAHRPLASLDGVPVTIKENVYTKGDPAPIGTAAGDLSPKPVDAPAAARTREAGCGISVPICSGPYPAAAAAPAPELDPLVLRSRRQGFR